ncbi:MAG: GNAT family N-acetyltransferase [Gemmatimonadota bacterium]|nr:GNAT family N-acetyltransferase [Gemmatimonadota bacterium]
MAHNPAYVIEESGRVIGFYILQPRSTSEVELTFLFVEPVEIGRGNGGRLMRHAISTASNLEFRTMHIQGDPHADGFYLAMGARKIGTRRSQSIPERELPLYNIDLDVREASSDLQSE